MVPAADTDVVFAALSHESRREIVLLLHHLGGELPSGYLAARFSHSWPTTTRHLSVLRKAGLVEVRREGRGAFYRLNHARARAVIEAWLAHLAPVDASRTWAPSGPRSTQALRTPHQEKPHQKGKAR
jgi:DNA-binding transcriptional ArsR family regulator